MSKEGFLLLHDEGRRSHIYYGVLGEGKLQFYSKRDRGIMVREVVLSRSRLKRSRIRDGRVFVYGAPVVLIMSAPTWGERKAWGNAIHAWQRNYWGEPQHRTLGLAPDELEVYFETQYKALQMMLQTAVSDPTKQEDGGGLEGRSRKERATAAAAAAAAVAVPRALFGRAQAVKKMGNKVSKRLREKAVTFSLPPMGFSVSTSVQNPPTV
uniref:PH domain-containing protein n=1 Tax=Hyaloperonospora arabidopsidis (strain Emoy2) TaxID=559515 RepID=M4BX09_HYAAE